MCIPTTLALTQAVIKLTDDESGDAGPSLTLVRDPNGRMPIHIAAMHGNLAAVKQLLDAGGSVHVQANQPQLTEKDKSGRTARDLAGAAQQVEARGDRFLGPFPEVVRLLDKEHEVGLSPHADDCC